MGSVGNRTLLVLAVILVVISMFGVYMTLSIQITPVVPSSTATGVVGVNIGSSQGRSAPPDTATGVVGLVILEPEIGD